MNPFRLLFSFRGRIGRVAYVFALLLAVALLALIVWGSFEALAAGAQALRGTGLNAASLQTGIWTIAGLLTTWMLLAVTVKRLHDRGRSGIWAFVTIVPAAAVMMLSLPILTIQPLYPLPEAAHFAMGGVSALVGLWVLIECLMLPGQRFAVDDLDDDDDPDGDGRIRLRHSS